jgi:hypothetical protein
MRDGGCAVRSHVNQSTHDCSAHRASCISHLSFTAHLLLHLLYKEMSMRTKIITVLFFLLIMSTFVVAQNTTSTSSAGVGSSASGNSGSFLNSGSSRGVQIPSNSGIGNVTIPSSTPSTSLFNSQNLNSPSAIDPSSGTPTNDEIVSDQSDLISSTNSFLNPSTDTTSNTRTQTSVLGETIFGNTIVPGMTNMPIVNVVPSTNPLTFGTTTTNPN